MSRLGKLKQTVETIERVVTAIKEGRIVLDRDCIEDLIREVVQAAEEGRYRIALELARRAERLAYPSAEDLLAMIRTQLDEAEKAWEGKDYAEAIQKLNRVLELCDKGEALINSEDNSLVASEIEVAKKTARENLRVVEVEKDLDLINKLLAVANRHIREGEKSIDLKDYDAGLRSFNAAAQRLDRALELAKKRGFEVRKEIKTSSKELRSKIYQVTMDKVVFHISECNQEKEISELLREIPKLGLSPRDQESLELMARKKRVRLEIEEVKKIISEAEQLAKKEESYPRAIEKYDSAKERLFQATKLAVDWELLEEKAEIDFLLDVTLKLKRKCEKKALLSPAVPEPAKPWALSEKRFDRLLERYVVEEILGEGAFAWVYKAVKKATKEAVALKIFKFLSKESEASFTREIEIWSKLDHENVVKRHAWGISPPFIEMELASSSLAKLKKPLPLRKVCRYGFEICRALNHAHSKGIYHRDLKPSNLLLFGDKVKVSDWGIARLSSSSATTSLHEAGTIFYMAPEQFEGVANARTDTYQLGVVLYELITGRRPFEGNTEPEVMRKILHEDPPKPSLLNPKAGKLEPVIIKCLEKVPAERFQTARELQYAIADIITQVYGERLEFSKRKEDRAEKKRWLVELVLVYLKLGETSKALGYAQALQEATGSEEVARLCEELEVRLKEEVEVPGERLGEIESVLLKYTV